MDSKTIEFENHIGMSSIKAMFKIKTFVADELKELLYIEEYNHATGHWGINYKYQKLQICFCSDYGSLDVFIILNSKEIALRDIDIFMENVIVASEKNIEYTLLAMKRMVKTLNLLNCLVLK